MLPKEITSEELRRLTNYGKATITELEQAGVISRTAKDTWPFPETVTAVIAHLRSKRPQLSDEQKAYHAARAKSAQVKLAQELGKLGSVGEMSGALT
jgi:hypothetical protein